MSPVTGIRFNTLLKAIKERVVTCAQGIFVLRIHFNFQKDSLLKVLCVCVCVVAEKTTGAMENIAAATGLLKKDEFPSDMNVCTLWHRLLATIWWNNVLFVVSEYFYMNRIEVIQVYWIQLHLLHWSRKRNWSQTKYLTTHKLTLKYCTVLSMLHINFWVPYLVECMYYLLKGAFSSLLLHLKCAPVDTFTKPPAEQTWHLLSWHVFYSLKKR